MYVVTQAYLTSYVGYVAQHLYTGTGPHTSFPTPGKAIRPQGKAAC